MKDILESIMDRLAEEVGSRPRAAVYIMIVLTLALVVSVLT